MNSPIVEHNIEHRDICGNLIKAGDYIAYSAVDGRSATLRIGQVIELKVVGKEEYDYKLNKYVTEFTPKIFVKSWSNFRAETWDRENQQRIKNGKSGRQKNVTLNFLDRLIIIPDSAVDQKIKDDLNGPITDYWGNPVSNS